MEGIKFTEFIIPSKAAKKILYNYKIIISTAEI